MLSGVGIGLRHPHLGQFLQDDRPDVPWLEVHAENFFAPESPELAKLLKIRESYPVAVHAIGLSLGGKALNHAHLAQLKTLVEQLNPALVSDHLAWCGEEGRVLPDLLPLPLTHAILQRTIEHVDSVQTTLKRQLLVENPSAYVAYREQDYSEAEFLAQLVQHTGCGLLLDVNNLYVSQVNLGYDTAAYLNTLPAQAVQEVHLAGHTKRDAYAIDTHSGPVDDAVLSLYKQAIELFPHAPALLEWDNDLPALDVLLTERNRLQHLLPPCHPSESWDLSQTNNHLLDGSQLSLG